MRIDLDKMVIQITPNDTCAILYMHSEPMSCHQERIDLPPEVDATLIISLEAYDELIQKLEQLDQNKLARHDRQFGLDGYTCSLKYSLNGENYDWKMFTPKYISELSEFKAVCSYIIALSGQGPDYVFD